MTSKAVFERVLEASTLSLPDLEKLSPVLVDAVACMLWGERWKERQSELCRWSDADAVWKLWKKQDETIHVCWRKVARRALSLLFGLKIAGKPETAKQSWARRLGAP